MMNLKTIVAATDLLSHSDSAWNTAMDLALANSAILHLVHVIDEIGAEEKDRESYHRLNSMVLPSQEASVQIRQTVLHGTAPTEIVAYADRVEADLIVLGTKQKSGWSRWTSSSVGQRVFNAASCPVLVVPHKQLGDPETVKIPGDIKYQELKSESPAIDLIARAVSLRATDIHIDPVEENLYQVRTRIDGRLSSFCFLDAAIAERLIHQFYTLAQVDGVDPFKPREGRLRLSPPLDQVGVRLTASPVSGGDAVALRLTSKGDVSIPMLALGFSEECYQAVEKMLSGREGLLLVTGPTGSGKTTTIYSMLETFAGLHRNIISIEDPVEYAIPFIRQLSVNEQHGFTMASGLKSMLRMDPDILFVGEIRDSQAADTSLRAASSGRFVFSTLHTRDVASTITALRDFGLESQAIAGKISGMVNQRLVRKLCGGCKRPIPPDSDCKLLFEENKLPIPNEIFEAVGCALCRNTGYHGRCGVFEVFACDSEFQKRIHDKASEAELRAFILSKGSRSLMAEFLVKIRDGITSFEEIKSLHWLDS